MPSQHTYIAIDLKSFYASVECVERGLNTLDTHLVVADASRTDRTICLAVSPSLKQYGTGGRPRLFEVNDKVNYLNKLRRAARGKSGDTCAKSFSASKLHDDPTLEIDFIVATPRMALYIDYSTRIHDVYLKYIAPEDIHVYSIDEVFIDATAYLKMYGKTPRQLTTTIIRDILRTTGITATAGIGPNLYLCKVAMDIVAKHSAPDEHGVRVAELDEMSYRRILWDHRPITDFWRVGKGVAQKLMLYGIDTMGKVARCSLANEDILYGMFGINAELLIDHAWGWEPCTMDMIKSYRPETNSISNSQILAEPYSWQKAETVIKEMSETLILGLTEKRMATERITITIGYQPTSRNDSVSTRHKSSHASINLGKYTSSSSIITSSILEIYRQTINKNFKIRRITVAFHHILCEKDIMPQTYTPSLFEEQEAVDHQAAPPTSEAKERKIKDTLIAIKNRYGKNSILTGTSFEDGATARERNRQIGGHKA